MWVDELKSKIYSQLQVNEPGPGYCHFPDTGAYDANYFRMLTAERMVTRRTGGKNRLRWELPKGRRNESLDCRGYAIGALNILKPDLDQIAKRGPMTGRDAPKRKRRVISRGVQ